MINNEEITASVDANTDSSIQTLRSPGHLAPHAAFHQGSLKEEKENVLKNKTFKILAISGSVRAASSNTALLQAAALLFDKKNIEIKIYAGIKEIPIFDADDENSPPANVVDFKSQLTNADGILIASPEYAHGVPGGLKNALDWTVNSAELEKKPLALLNARERSKHAPEALAEIIKTMGGHIVKEASVIVPLGTHRIDAQGILAKPEVCKVLQQAVETFCKEIQVLQEANNSQMTLS